MNTTLQEKPGTWSADYPVRSYEVDAAGRLSTPSILNLMQDAASRHAGSMGLSVEQLAKENATWVLSQLRMKILTPPRFGETATVRTWIAGEDRRIFSLREFQLISGKGEIFAEAASAWMAIDVIKHRPLRIRTFDDRIETVPEQRVFSTPLEKLPTVDCPVVKTTIHVTYSDLDINQHVNNACYVKWLIDSASDRLRNGQMLEEIEADYLGEARLGDSVAVCSNATDVAASSCHHVIRGADSGRRLMHARTTWKNASA